MKRLLVLSDQFPVDLTSGRYLRVNHLCRQLGAEFECFLVDLSDEIQSARSVEQLGLKGAHSLPRVPAEKGRLRRHFRMSNADYYARSSPDYYATIVAQLDELIREWGIDAIINFSAERAEFIAHIDLPRLLDYTDCDTLTLERVLAQRGASMTLRERISTQIQYWRQYRMERSVISSYDLTTTIAEPDRLRMLELSGIGDDRILVIPNGVSAAAMELGECPPPADRSIVFWGNLHFAPNWTAVKYFFDQVFQPYLAGKGITWRIIGGGAGADLDSVFDHPDVEAMGFRQDLFENVLGSAVMVNPMVEGSGLKNKVLEAFALGIPVVSTPLGVEGIELTPGLHCAVCEDPKSFAETVLGIVENGASGDRYRTEARKLVEQQYSWKQVGSRFVEVVYQLVS